MKALLLVIGFIFSLFTFGQDTSKTNNQNRMVKFPASPSLTFVKSTTHTLSLQYSKTGTFKIDTLFVYEKSKATKALQKKGIGTTVHLTKNSIKGTYIDSTTFIYLENEKLETDDYLYRAFGALPKNRPSNLPKYLYVQRITSTTNAIDLPYGLALLDNGTLLLPYKGILLYLVKI